MAKINKGTFNLKYSKSIKHDLDYFIGKPSICIIIITDILNDEYESEIHLKKGWDDKGFTRAITQSLMLCDQTPKGILIKRFQLMD